MVTLPDVAWLNVSPAPPRYFGANEIPLTKLDGLGRVNIFVGPNNGGKSRLMRGIATRDEFSFGVPGANLAELRKTIAYCRMQLEELWSTGPGLQNLGPVTRDILSRVVVPEELSATKDSLESIRNVASVLSAASESHSTTRTNHQAVPPHLLAARCRTLGADISGALETISVLDPKTLAPKERIYIPILRGLRPLNERHDDLFAERTRGDYFKDNPSAPRIFTGQTLYHELRDHLLGPRDKRDHIRAYEQFLASEIFDTDHVTLIPRQGSDVVYIRIGGDPELPVHDLGDGVQNIIVLTYLYFALERCWFFIEEPEMFLHPGLQRRLLNLLLSQDRGHRTFLTTHSNHLLDMSLDYAGVAIYGVRKVHKPDGAQVKVEVLDRADQTALNLLGVRSSSVLLVNATIWVEGITDRFYLRRLLELYIESLRDGAWKPSEDLHYCFVEYGGANAVHFSFVDGYEDHPVNVERLCGRAFVVMDDDGGKNAERKAAMTKVLEDRLVVLPCREIENLLPWSVISSVVAEYEGTPAASIPAASPEEFSKELLGSFIEDRLGASMQRKGGYAAESGTLKDKRHFCERALECMDAGTIAALTNDARRVVERIYTFIQQQNA